MAGVAKMFARIANRKDPDQTASSEAVWSGSVLFFKAFLEESVFEIKNIYSVLSENTGCQIDADLTQCSLCTCQILQIQLHQHICSPPYWGFLRENLSFGFEIGKPQTNILSYRDYLESWNIWTFGCIMYSYYLGVPRKLCSLLGFWPGHVQISQLIYRD